MGYKILDVKADIHEDVEMYFLKLNFDDLNEQTLKEEVLEIIDENFEKIER